VSQASLGGFRVLCLDGGGLLCLIQLIILLQLEEMFWPLKASSLFDIIVGTSGGGVIAMCLLQGKPLAAARDMLKIRASTIFDVSSPVEWWCMLAGQPSRNTQAWEDLLDEFLGKKHCSRVEADGVKTPVIAATVVDLQTDLVGLVGQLPPQEELVATSSKSLANCVVTKKMAVWTIHGLSPSRAALCTSAAPTFFAPVVMPTSWCKQLGLEHHIFVDGGVKANCPAKIALQLAKEMSLGQMDAPVESCVSLGTGLLAEDDCAKLQKPKGTIGWAKHFAHHAMNSERQWSEAVSSGPLTLIGEESSLRINPPSLGSLNPFRTSSIEPVELGMQEYLQGVGADKMIQLFHLTFAKMHYIKFEANFMEQNVETARIQVRHRLDLQAMSFQDLEKALELRGLSEPAPSGLEELRERVADAMQRQPAVCALAGSFEALFAGKKFPVSDKHIVISVPAGIVPEGHDSNLELLNVTWRTDDGKAHSLSGFPRMVRVMKKYQ
jgi:predicted acylesterase/phospholipase RssA